MVKDTNKRVMITLSKKQITWLNKFCKKHNITVSQFIKWQVSLKAQEMITLLKLVKDADTGIEDMEALNEIVKAKWLD
jgi:hypothetical protein